MKKRLKQVLTVMLVISMTVGMFAGCNKKEAVETPTKKSDQQSKVTEVPVVQYVPGENAPERLKAYFVASTLPQDQLKFRYEEPVTISFARGSSATQKFAEGDDYTKNPYTELYKEVYNLDIKTNWIVDESNYAEKIGYDIAAGNIPDIFSATPEQYQMLIENDAIWDLTDIFDEYASDIIKALANADMTAFNAAKVGGRLMGIAPGGDTLNGSDMLYIRNDWLKELNLELPKTMDDVINVAKAFVTSGKATQGLGVVSSDYDVWFGSLQGFFGGYHAYPGIWTEDESGKLIYGSTQLEMKEALNALAGLYKDGAIAVDFGTKNSDILAYDDAAVGLNCGLAYGDWWAGSLWPLQKTIDNDEKADWIPIALPSVDDQPAKTVARIPADKFMVVSKQCKNPEALILMMNIAADVEEVSKTDIDAAFPIKAGGTTEEQLDYWRLPIGGVSNPRQNYEKFEQISVALETGNTDNMTDLNIIGSFEGAKTFYDIVGAEVGIHYCSFAKEGSMSILQNYKDTNNVVYNRFYGAQTETMAAKGATLKDQELTMITKIIIGDWSIDKFDEFVASYKKLGGDQIEQEVNDWYSEIK